MSITERKNVMTFNSFWFEFTRSRVRDLFLFFFCRYRFLKLKFWTDAISDAYRTYLMLFLCSFFKGSVIRDLNLIVLQSLTRWYIEFKCVNWPYTTGVFYWGDFGPSSFKEHNLELLLSRCYNMRLPLAYILSFLVLIYTKAYPSITQRITRRT